MRQLAVQYGYQLFGLVSLVLGPMIGLYIKRKGAGIDVQTRKDAMALDAQAVPLKLLQDELQKRELELSQLRAQDKLERDEYLKTLSGIQATMEKMAATLDRQEHRQDQHAQRVESRLDDVDSRLLVIETRQQAGA